MVCKAYKNQQIQYTILPRKKQAKTAAHGRFSGLYGLISLAPHKTEAKDISPARGKEGQ
nr:MAG TPA_asm: hypothetical protein [Caudoviricetes sp.]